MLPHPIARCSKTLAANASAAPLDVVKMKSVLKALGHYKAPEWGVLQYPDAEMFAAIKKFQRAQGLKPDGTVKPDGETEAALNRALTPRRATTALQSTAQALQAMGRGGDELLAHITREEAALLHSVTDGATINPQTGLLEFFWGGSDRDADGNGYDNDAQHGDTDASAAEASDAQAAENDQQGRDDTRDNDGGDRVLNPKARGGGELTQKSTAPSTPAMTQTSEREDGGKTYARRSRTVTVPRSLANHLLDTKLQYEEDDLDAQHGYTNPSVANDEQAVENENQHNAFDSVDRGDSAGYGDMTTVNAVNKARDEREMASQKRDKKQTEDTFIEALRKIFTSVTAWHFEDRDLLNAPLPTTEAKAVKMGFTKYSKGQSYLHQNEKGKPETKYGHPDGREVVFDGDTGNVVASDRYRGSYNYVNPSPFPENYTGLSAWERYVVDGLGHTAVDITPYWVGGNVRGPN